MAPVAEDVGLAETPDAIGLRWWLALGILTIVVRAVYVVTAARATLPFTDALWYHFQAGLIVKGKWFLDPLAYTFTGQSHPSAAHPPLYPLLLAAASPLGQSVRAEELLGCAIGLATVVAITLVARDLVGRRAALLADLLAAVYPPFWLNDGGVMSEGLYACTIAFVLLASYRFARKPNIANAVFVGITIALAALTRVEAVLVLVGRTGRGRGPRHPPAARQTDLTVGGHARIGNGGGGDYLGLFALPGSGRGRARDRRRGRL